MRIGLISDTHVPGPFPEPPSQVAIAFQGVDLILHAGDIYAASCLDWLESIAPVQAVEKSPSPYWDGDSRVAAKRVLELGGYTIGLVHELPLPGMTAASQPRSSQADGPLDGALKRALGAFFGQQVDIAVFGHTHEPLLERHPGVLLVNPGSPTLPLHIRGLGTVGILELTPEGPQAQIVDLARLV